MAYLPGQQYARSAAGVWTPVGYGAGDLAMPTMNPDLMATGSITARDAVSASVATSPTTWATHNVITGTPTAGSAVMLTLSGESSFSGQITGTWTGTLQVERSVDDGATWTDVGVFVAGSAGTTKTFTANSAFHGNASAASTVRLRAVSATWTGSATIVLRTGAGTGTITLATPVGIRDATNPTRQVTVSAAGALDVNIAASSSNLVSQSGTLTAVAASPTAGVAGTSTSSVVADVGAAGNATVVVLTAGTVAGNLVFEATIDPAGAAASWFSIDATRSDGSAVETRAVLPGTGATAWNLTVPGYKFVRVRLAAATTVGTVTATIVPGAFLFDPSPTVTQNPLAALQGPSTAQGAVAAPAYATGTAAATAVTLLAAPGAGLSIYVTDMEGSNEGTTATAAALMEGSTVRYRRFMAASGGGFVTNLRTPWKLPAATALTYTVTAATTWNLSLNYYIAP